ncbi:hypothetical protein K491DRAFT_673307 [Lophiostoma macrostomum CBS 122681]|uniref:SWIM-type domain-containing protein n=1 Tax=Lophiostoma macrostomum CBS 122681 TaxID=1314788 RepID=A0A6A6TQ77_9PLEO|nr:hypothetical protein K491DRAFT_673307 [Lophiostoma macrostomum CBS 122681]
MPRKKVDAVDLEQAEEVPLQPRRSGRKRKSTNYAEPKAEEADWKASPEKKSMIKKPKTENDKATIAAPVHAAIVVDDASPPPPTRPKPKKRARKARDDEVEYDHHGNEIRKREYLSYPPDKFEGKLERALNETRIAVIDRERTDSDGVPRERFTMMGNCYKGYTVNIGLVPKCDCMDFLMRRNSCKHIIYVLYHVLNVAYDSEFLYQHAFTTDELHRLLNEQTLAPAAAPQDLTRDGKQKEVEGECSICYTEFEPAKDSTVHCKSQCGNNFHSDCMKLWIRAQTNQYGKATCPMCRAIWVH